MRRFWSGNGHHTTSVNKGALSLSLSLLPIQAGKRRKRRGEVRLIKFVSGECQTESSESLFFLLLLTLLQAVSRQIKTSCALSTDLRTSNCESLAFPYLSTPCCVDIFWLDDTIATYAVNSASLDWRPQRRQEDICASILKSRNRLRQDRAISSSIRLLSGSSRRKSVVYMQNYDARRALTGCLCEVEAMRGSGSLQASLTPKVLMACTQPPQV